MYQLVVVGTWVTWGHWHWVHRNNDHRTQTKVKSIQIQSLSYLEQIVDHLSTSNGIGSAVRVSTSPETGCEIRSCRACRCSLSDTE